MLATTAHWQQEIDVAIDAHAAAMIELRRHLHAHPEPSGEEYETSLYIQHHLDEAGFSTQLAPQKRGLIAEAASPNSNSAPRIALRADIDALRIQDIKTVEYHSQQPEVMHACGHDGHAAVVYGALLGLKAASEAGVLPWPVNFRGIFQPAEETGAGALEMIEAGALEGVQAILAAHLDPSRRVGRIGVRYGTLTAACDSIDILIFGRGGHAARPHESLDPIAAAAQLISSIYLFIPRATDTQDPVVVTIGQVIAGHNPNVIPECAQLKGTLRTLGGEIRERTKRHIEQLARGLAEASGTRIEVRFDLGPESVRNDTHLSDLLKETACNLLGPENVDIIARTSMGGEDFSFYLDHVPGAMFRLGCAAPEPDAPGAGTSLHSPDFDIDERALTVGAKILARTAVMWSDPQRHLPVVPLNGQSSL
jgi:amidohydrolase